MTGERREETITHTHAETHAETHTPAQIHVHRYRDTETQRHGGAEARVGGTRAQSSDGLGSTQVT